MADRRPYHRPSAVGPLLYRLCVLVMGALVTGMAVPAAAQVDLGDLPGRTWEVYLEREIDADGRDRLIFLDMLTGASSSYEVVGERYTPAGSYILYFDPLNRQVMRVSAGEAPAPHPFIRLETGAQRVDWVVSTDMRRIAWTLTYGEAGSLTTVTYVAGVDGLDRREVLRDGPRPVRALPVAFGVENNTLIMDAHPFGLERFLVYMQYAGLFALDLEDSTVETLPGEPACFCGAGIRAGTFVRLVLGAGGFDMHVYTLGSDRQQVIPALPLNNYTQAGAVLISPDGAQAVYALSRIEDFGTSQQSINTVFMLADLRGLTQRTLTEPLTTLVQPVRWTEDSTAVLFTSPQENGTWKVYLEDGEMVQVARASFLGVLQRPAPP